MKKYNFVKKEIDNILNSNEIKYDGEYISAYELKNIIDSELKELYQLLDDKEDMINLNRNNSYINIAYRKLINVFLTEKKVSNKFKNIFSIILKSDKNMSEISFGLYKKNNRYTGNYTYINVKKEKNRDELFFETNIDEKTTKDFINYNLEYITDTFDIMKYFTDKFDFNISCNWIESPYTKYEFEDKIFKISFNLLRETCVKIIPCNKELEEILGKMWLSKETLNNIIINNEYELLKRIPIKISSLNPLYTKILESSLQKKTIKVKKKVVSEN